MSEAEAIGILSDIAETAGVYFSIFLSLTFAYLTAAYFVGAALSGLQNAIVSGIYLLSTVLIGSTAVGWSNAWSALHAREPTILHEVAMFETVGWIETGVYVMLATITAASVFFMFDIRRRGRTAANTDD